MTNDTRNQFDDPYHCVICGDYMQVKKTTDDYKGILEERMCSRCGTTSEIYISDTEVKRTQS